MAEITLPPLPESPPAKLWELVHMAHGDLKLRERDERYEVNMGWYHKPRTSSSKCFVCLAGCVISRDASPEDPTSPSEYSQSWRDAFFALDYIRQNDIGLAIKVFYQYDLSDVSNRLDEFYTELQDIDDDFTVYGKDQVAFHSWLYKLTELLKKYGI